MTPETQFAPLPVRQRGTLEIIDTALKLYRRYFGVLMAWSAIVAASYLLGALAFASFLAMPLIYGASACAVAAAVRGQRITFGQVWDFTKPRYGALLLLFLLTGLLLGAAVMAIFFVSTMATVAGVWLLSSVNAPDSLSVIFGVIGGVIFTVVTSVLSVMAYAWLQMVPIIACLEDDKRGTPAMGRAWELMKGSWTRVLGLSTLLTVAVLAVLAMVGAGLALFGQGFGALLDSPSESAILGLMLTFSAFWMVFMLFWNPIQTLIIAVLYLDLRVRKEALDLEWTSYNSAPPAPASVPAVAPDVSLNAAHLSPSALNSSPAAFAVENSPPRPPTPATVASVEAAPAQRPPAPISTESAVAPPSFSPAPPPVVSPAPPSADEPFSSSFGAGLTAPPFDAGDGESDAQR